MKGVAILKRSIMTRWESTNISGIYVSEKLQIFDGRHRLTALKSLKKSEFESIFGVEGGEDCAGGVRIKIFKDFDPSILIFLSQSKDFNLNLDFNQASSTNVTTTFSNELYFIDKVIISINFTLTKSTPKYSTVKLK